MHTSGELCVPEVCASGELRAPEVCASGELRAPEVCVFGELCIPEICLTVEPGRAELTLFNGEVIQGVENGRAAKVELKGAPCAGGNGYLLALIHADLAALAHFLEDSATYVLLFVKLCIVCSYVFRFFILIRLIETCL